MQHELDPPGRRMDRGLPVRGSFTTSTGIRTPDGKDFGTPITGGSVSGESSSPSDRYSAARASGPAPRPMAQCNRIRMPIAGTRERLLARHIEAAKAAALASATTAVRTTVLCGSEDWGGGAVVDVS